LSVITGASLAAAVLVSGRAVAQRADQLPSIAFEKYTLPNGLEVLLSEDKRLPLVAVNIWYHVGPANEARGRTGFAHLFEHMMFQGSKHVPGDGHFRLLEAAGASTVNGTTGFDRTNYFETLPSDQLELGLWLEADRMGFLLDTVDELKLANQQDVVRNERRQSRENTPYGLAGEALYQLIFPSGHPYHGNIIGSHGDIQAAKLAEIKAFFREYYAPNNASLAIVGDIDKARTKALVEKYFGTLKRGPAVTPAAVPPPVVDAERRRTVRDRVQLSRVYMGWVTPAFFAPGDSEADAAATILGGNTSSRLYKRLVYEGQIAQDVSAYQASHALGSVFHVIATVRPGHTVEEVEKALTEEIERLRREGPTEAEVERARNTFETAVLQGLEHLGGFGGVADALNMFNHYLGDPGYLPKYIDEHRKLSPAAIKTFAERYLTPSARAVVHVVPGDPELGPQVPTPPAPDVPAGTGAEAINTDEPWRATPPRSSAGAATTLPAPSSFRLANGLTVLHYTRAGLPLAAASLVIRSGGDSNPPERSGLANFTATLLDQGTTTRSAMSIADSLAQIGASLNASSTKDSMSVSIGSLTTHFGAALDLLADVTLRPSFPADEVERQRQRRLASLAATRQNASAVAQVNAVMALFGPSHSYGSIELGDESAARATTRDDVVAFWRRHFVPANAALVVSGPLTERELRPLVEEAFGGWSGSAAPPATSLGTPSPSSARVVISDRPGAPQTQLVIAGIGAPRNVPDFPALSVLNAALGGLFSSRINLNLREAHGYTYGAGSQFVFRKHPGIFWVRTGVRTDVTGPAVAEIFKEVRGILERPLSNEELQAARDSFVRSFPASFETSASTASTLGDLFVYQLGLDYYREVLAQAASVTPEAALAAARKYIDPNKLIVIAVGDRARIEPQLKGLNLGAIEIRDADGRRLP
jgi:zinc protease